MQGRELSSFGIVRQPGGQVQCAWEQPTTVVCPRAHTVLHNVTYGPNSLFVVEVISCPCIWAMQPNPTPSSSP
jgi:hypothetical protein